MRRWKVKLSITSLFLLGAVQAMAQDPHEAVPLRDIEGNPITLSENDTITINGVTYKAGNPVSWEATCGHCHDAITGNVKQGVHSPGPIHTAYHIGRGWEEMSDDFGTERVLKGKDWRKFIRSFGDDGAW
ncbi:MAG: hypothetical protein ABGX12_03140 [Desulfurobacteriaceae bacterium]